MEKQNIGGKGWDGKKWERSEEEEGRSLCFKCSDATANIPMFFSS